MTIPITGTFDTTVSISGTFDTTASISGAVGVFVETPAAPTLDFSSADNSQYLGAIL